MKLRYLGLIFAGLMLISGAVQAAVLSLTDPTPNDVIPGNFNPTGWPGGLVGPLVSIGDPIRTFGPADAGHGLQLSGGPATLNFQYLGKEAGFNNIFNLGGDLFSTNGSVPSLTPTQVSGVSDGLVPFVFKIGGSLLSATNGGAMSTGLSIAFADLGDGSFLALFNDGGGHDTDYDDMVVRVSVANVSAVPLPAAAWLLLSAVLGLVSFSRIRRTGPQTA